MKKGFLSFALAALFLLSFLSAAFIVSSSRPNNSYEGSRAFLVFEVSAKRAFYSALSESAKGASALSSGTGAGAREEAEAAAYRRALIFSEEMRLQGYDAEFWCGEPSESARTAASESMLGQKRAVIPEGAKPLSGCAASFQADALSRKLHLSGLGASFYHPLLGLGKAATFPSDYEVDY